MALSFSLSQWFLISDLVVVLVGSCTCSNLWVKRRSVSLLEFPERVDPKIPAIAMLCSLCRCQHGLRSSRYNLGFPWGQCSQAVCGHHHLWGAVLPGYTHLSCSRSHGWHWLSSTITSRPWEEGLASSYCLRRRLISKPTGVSYEIYW